MAEAATLSQPADLTSKYRLSFSAELAQYDKIVSLRDDVFAGKHPRIKLSAPPQMANNPLSNSPKLPNGSHLPPASLNTPENVSVRPHSVANNLKPTPLKAPSPVLHTSGLNPIFLQESEVVVKAKMKLERQRIERSLQDQIKRRDANRQRISDQDILPDFDVTDVFLQAQELVKPIQADEANTAHRRISSSDIVDDNTYYSSQGNDSPGEDSEENAKRKATKPCRYFFEGSCRKGNNCTFSHDPAFKQKLQSTANADLTDHDSGPNLFASARGYTAKGGRIRDSPTYGSRESGELVEDSPPSPNVQAPPEDSGRPSNIQNGRARNDGIASRTRSQIDSRQPRRPTPPSKEGRIVRNHITSPAAPQPSRVSPLAVAKVSRVDRSRHGTGEPSPRQFRQPVSGQRTPVTATLPRSRKRRRDIDVDEGSRNVAPRRRIESPVPYIKEEPVSPPPLQSLPPSRVLQREEIRRPVEMGPPSPRYRERVVYQPVQEEYIQPDGSHVRRVSSPSVRRVISGPIHQESYREPDLRRVVSSRFVDRPGSPHQEVVSVSGQPRSTRAMSQFAAPAEETQYIYKQPVQPQRPIYNHDERPTSPVVRYTHQLPPEPELVPLAPPAPRRIVVDEHGNRYYEAPAPVPDRRASVMPEIRYVPEVSRRVEPGPSGRASVRPENARAYHDDHYSRRAVSPPPAQPSYVQYRGSVQPSSQRVIYEADGMQEPRGRQEVVRVVEYPQERVVERYGEFARPREPGYVRMQSVRPSEMAYEAPPERYRVQTVQPEQQRYVEVPRDGSGYVREVRELSVRPEGGYGPQDYAEVGRPRYQYVSGAPPGMRPVSRAIDREMAIG